MRVQLVIAACATIVIGNIHPLGAVSAAHAQAETPASIVATQIRRQGYKCDKPLSAEQDSARRCGLIGGVGADILDGGTGTDTADYSDSASGITADLAAGSGSAGDALGDTYTSIENVTGSALDDTITGDVNANVLDGGAGDDTLSGGDESDIFIFQMGGGTDTINGGAAGGWTDTIQVQDASGGSNLGTYGVDWTVTLSEGTIDAHDANGLDLSDDADGTITLSDGSIANFFDIERLDF